MRSASGRIAAQCRRNDACQRIGKKLGKLQRDQIVAHADIAKAVPALEAGNDVDIADAIIADRQDGVLRSQWLGSGQHEIHGERAMGRAVANHETGRKCPGPVQQALQCRHDPAFRGTAARQAPAFQRMEQQKARGQQLSPAVAFAAERGAVEIQRDCSAGQRLDPFGTHGAKCLSEFIQHAETEIGTLRQRVTHQRLLAPHDTRGPAEPAREVGHIEDEFAALRHLQIATPGTKRLITLRRMLG